MKIHSFERGGRNISLRALYLPSFLNSNPCELNPCKLHGVRWRLFPHLDCSTLHWAPGVLLEITLITRKIISGCLCGSIWLDRATVLPESSVVWWTFTLAKHIDTMSSVAYFWAAFIARGCSWVFAFWRVRLCLKFIKSQGTIDHWHKDPRKPLCVDVHDV